MKGRKTNQKQKSGIKSVIEKKKRNPQKNQWRSKGYNKKWRNFLFLFSSQKKAS